MSNCAASLAGVIRSNCTYMRSWQAYKCFDLNYRMLVIESLDADTETRRLSPVAVLGDGFVDLINGGILSISLCQATVRCRRFNYIYR